MAVYIKITAKSGLEFILESTLLYKAMKWMSIQKFAIF